jgi:outer membrane lipopolysaccharide assembly protein LptE/RlpB
MKLIGTISLLIMLLINISGCGVYSFSSSGKAPFESLHVTQFENNTIEYQLSDLLTVAVVEAFIHDNTVEIKESSRAEAIMKGTVVSYRRDPYTYDQSDEVSEYAVKVAVHIKVVKSDSEEIIWEKEFYTEGIYDALAETEVDGQKRAAAQITGDIISSTTKSW